MSILSKIQSLISAANSATGESDTTLTDAVQTLVDGYGQGGGVVDATQYCNSIVFGDQYPSENPELYLPKVTALDNLFHKSFDGPYKTIKVTCEKPITTMRNAFWSFRVDSMLTSIELNADLSQCSVYQDTFTNLAALTEIKGVELDFTYATATNNAYRNWASYEGGMAALTYVRYKANTLSKGQSLISCPALSDDSIVSIANGLVAVSGFTITFHATVKAKLSTIMGTVSQVTKDGVTYDFFTASASGTVSLMDFITTTKGWTVA